MEREQLNRIVIRAIALIEMFIGLFIPIDLIVAFFAANPSRPAPVYFFVGVTSLISVIIGLGLFKYKSWGRKILIFFAGYVIITKILIFSRLITFTGNTIDLIPVMEKDILSLIYHTALLVVLNLKSFTSELK